MAPHSLLRPLLLPLLAAGLLLAPASAHAQPNHTPNTQDTWTAPPRHKGPSRHFIAVLANGVTDCPAIVGWTTTKLFPKMSKVSVLKDFCRYNANGKDGVAALPPTAGLASSSPDFDVLVPQSDLPLASNPSVRAALATAYRKEIGIVPSGVKQSVYMNNQTLPRVAVIDTVPANYDLTTAYAAATPRAQHGLAMAEIIGDVRCPNGESNCRTRTFFVDAYRTKPIDPAVFPSSDTLGSMSTLAQAILDAVDTNDANETKAPLILNLSLGWDPHRYGTISRQPGDTHVTMLRNATSTSSTTVRAIHAAMAYAVCRGALPIAAAGNNTGGACEEQGPLAPAAWEQIKAPTQQECKELFGINDAPVAASGRLVYAAGGVESGKMIPIARKGSRPRRLVAAFQAVAGMDWRTTDPWTGTSVAAAGLSGLAAMVWSHQPGFNAHEVMAALDASGRELLLPVELNPKDPPQKARVLTGHAAFAATCSGRTCAKNPYKSPISPNNNGVQPFPSKGQLPITAQRITEVDAIEAITTAGEDALKQLGKQQLTSCGLPRLHYYPRTVSKQGPVDKLPPNTAPASPPPPVGGVSQPWTRPQPETMICPYCPVKGGTLFLSVNPKFATSGQSVKLTDPLLEFSTPNGYLSVTLSGQITVPAEGKEISLAAYQVKYLDDETSRLSEVVADPAITDGTLTVFVKDTAGNTVGLVSVVQVLH